MPKYTLEVELIPQSSWYNNVRSEFGSDWDLIRFDIYHHAKQKCEICNDTGFNQGFNHSLECHEKWEYDNKTSVQKLTGFIALCPYCHKCKHPGLAYSKGEDELVLSHLMKVNGITKKQANNLVLNAFFLWEKRSRITWKIDLQYAYDYIDQLFTKHYE